MLLYPHASWVRRQLIQSAGLGFRSICSVTGLKSLTCMCATASVAHTITHVTAIPLPTSLEVQDVVIGSVPFIDAQYSPSRDAIQAEPFPVGFGSLHPSRL